MLADAPPSAPSCAHALRMIRHRGRIDALARHGHNDPLLPNDGSGSSASEEEHQQQQSEQRATAAPAPLATSKLEAFFPCYKWMKSYNIQNYLFTDVVSGMAVGIMVIPQGMSYAKLAGLPVQYGLYSAVAPVFAYAVYGSSNQLAVGPVAMVSLLFHDGLAKIMAAQDNDVTMDTDLYEPLAVQAAAAVGIAYLIMYACRLGWITTYLSHAVISGFTTGAAILIAMSQLKHILGYSVTGSTLIEIVWSILKGIDSINWSTVGLGGVFTVCLVLVKYLKAKFPSLGPLQTAGPLLVTIVALWLPNTNGVLPIVGEIPRGLPSLTVHAWWPLKDLVQFLPTISSIIIVGFMESIAIAKQLAMKHNDEVDANAELFGLGMANLLGGAFHAYPVTGSFSRSAVNSNAHSPLSGAVTATTVCLSLVFLTPIFQHLPLCALAAIVLSGVFGVVDVQEAFHLYALDRGDFAVWMTACIGVLCLGVEAGLIASIVVSFAVLIPWRPAVKRMGRLPESMTFIDYDSFSEAPSGMRDDVVVLRLSSSLNFANVNYVLSMLNKHSTDGVRCIILDTNGVTFIDSSSRKVLQTWLNWCNQRHVRVYFAGCSKRIEESLSSCDNFDSKAFQITISEAVLAYEEDTERGDNNA